MAELLGLVFLVTLIAFIVLWWKKKNARLAAGTDYENDAAYRSISAKKRYVGIVCVASLFSGALLNANGLHNITGTLGVMALVAAIFCWRKQSAAHKDDSEDSDAAYLRYGKLKRVLGVLCVVLFVVSAATTPELTPEERLQRELRQAEREVKQQWYDTSSKLSNNSTESKIDSVEAVSKDEVFIYFTSTDKQTKVQSHGRMGFRKNADGEWHTYLGSLTWFD